LCIQGSGRQLLPRDTHCKHSLHAEHVAVRDARAKDVTSEEKQLFQLQLATGVTGTLLHFAVIATKADFTAPSTQILTSPRKVDFTLPPQTTSTAAQSTAPTKDDHQHGREPGPASRA